MHAVSFDVNRFEYVNVFVFKVSPGSVGHLPSSVEQVQFPSFMTIQSCEGNEYQRSNVPSEWLK